MMNKTAFVSCLALALASSACNTACDKLFRSKHASPPVPLREGAALVLDVPGGDVWTWQAELAGHAPEKTEISRCAATVRGERIDLSTYAGRFSGKIALEPGVNAVSVDCQGVGPTIHKSREVRYVVRLKDAPIARVVARASREGTTLDSAASEQTSKQPTPLTSFTWWHESGHVLGTDRTLLVPASAERQRVRLVVRDSLGHSDETTVLVGPEGIERGARWLDGAVVYGVVPPRFGSPPLRAVTRSLPRLAKLGIDVLWLTPVFEAPAGDFGYAVTDYGRVRADYGTEADLHELVRAAHRLGLRVVLDWVPNHTSASHPYYQQAERFGMRAQTFGFYDRDEKGAATYYFDWKHLPNLDYAKPEVARFMTEVSTDWLRRYDVDGFRVDAAWGIRERSPAFYDAWLSELRRIEPELMLLAEASARDDFYLSHGFDAAYDWTAKTGEWAWEHVFDVEEEVPKRLEDALRATDAATPASRVFRFLNNNDSGARFVSRHGVGKSRVATATLLTMPGVPCLFTGDEVGAEFEPYGKPGAVRTDDPHGFYASTARLIALRRARPSLRSDKWIKLETRANAPGVYAVLREDTRTHERTAAIFHFGSRATRVEIDVGSVKRFRDLLANAELDTSGGVLRIDLPAHGYAFLEPK